MYKIQNKELKVLLIHPGGPIFTNKDKGFWGIPKGCVNDGENLFDTAIREFQEETSITVNRNQKFIELGKVLKKSGKTIHAWAFQGDFDGKITSNLFKMEWPPKSGKLCNFPEVDKGEFFTIQQAKEKMHPPQWAFIERLIEKLK